MTVTPVQTAAIPRQSQSAAAQLSSNFDTFLTLLTTQLKNQDPLSPMDANQFTEQLVQFAGVEQQINTNKNLETLIGLGRGQAGSSAVAYLGKTVTLTDGSAALNDGSATWSYTLAGESADTVFTVTDAQNRIVYVGHGETGAGEHTFEWDGRSTAGTQLPDGKYTLTVNAIGVDGKTVACPVTSRGVVSEVDLTGDEPILKIGAMGVPLSKASLISGTTATDELSDALSAPLGVLSAPIDAVSALLPAL